MKDCYSDNLSETHIMLFYFVLSFYSTVFACSREYTLSSLAPVLCVTVRLKVRSAVARSGTQAGGSTVRSAVTVDSEMRD